MPSSILFLGLSLLQRLRLFQESTLALAVPIPALFPHPTFGQDGWWMAQLEEKIYKRKPENRALGHRSLRHRREPNPFDAFKGSRKVEHWYNRLVGQ